MAVHLKAGRAHLSDSRQTTVDIVDLATGLAVEVVMVGQIGRLVTGRLSGHVDHLEMTFFDQAF